MSSQTNLPPPASHYLPSAIACSNGELIRGLLLNANRLIIPPDNQSNNGLTRRDFIRSAASAGFAAAAFPTIIPGSALGKDGAVAPSNRITVGVIGCGPQGQLDMRNFLFQDNCQVVAVCDVKNDQLEQARALVNNQYGNQNCRTHHDFRELVARN